MVFASSTEGYSWIPVLAQGARPLVPRLTGLHELHLSAKVAKNSSGFPFNRARRQRLSSEAKHVGQGDHKNRWTGKYDLYGFLIMELIPYIHNI